MKKFTIFIMITLAMACMASDFAFADINGIWNVTYSGIQYDYYTDQVEIINKTGTITINKSGDNISVVLSDDPDGPFSGYCGQKTFGAKREASTWADTIVGSVDDNNVLSGTLTICDFYYGSSSGAQVLEFSSGPSNINEYQKGYEAGRQACIDDPASCGISCDSCCNGGNSVPVLSLELNIHIPELRYDTVFGTMNLWADFEYAGEVNDDLYWRLSDCGMK